MFAPDINTTKNQITTLFNEINGITGYSTGIQNTLIGTIPKEPAWIPEVRSEMKLLSKAGTNWLDNYSNSWADILTVFIDYGTQFESFSKEMTKNLKNLSDQQIIELLTSLSNALDTCASKTKSGLDHLTSFENQFTVVFPSLQASIESGWNELGEEEAEMIAIAEAITHLQDQISSLQSKIDSAGISGGKTFVQTNVKIAYNIITATSEVAIPYLSIVVLAYTIGKTFYDVISDTDKINEDLTKIGDLQLEATEEAQAAAATKATIQYLYDIEIKFLSLQKHGDELWTMWKDQKARINEAINAINAGADVSKFLDILTMDVASKNWKALLDFANQIVTMRREFGPQVILQTKKPN